MDNSEASARAILGQYLELAAAEMAGEIQAIVLIGSLATGSYIAGPGDIDQVTILRDSAPAEAAGGVHCLIDEVMRRCDHAVHMADMIYRRSDFDRPWPQSWDLDPATRHMVTIPEELLRMHDHGQVVFGRLDIVDLPCPSREEMTAYRQRWRQWNAQWEAANSGLNAGLNLLNRPRIPLRISVQCTLSNAMDHYYFATGKTCFSKHQIGARLRQEVPGYLFADQVELATKVRMGGFIASAEEEAALSEGCKKMLQWMREHAVAAVPADGLADNQDA